MKRTQTATADALISRRQLLGLALLSLGASARASSAAAHSNAGRVLPRVAPPRMPLTLQDKKQTSLQKLLPGHVTALQLVFTRCRATCPIQGALFGAAAKELGERLPQAQLISISIDPANDDPAALDTWLKRHGQSARWRAAQPTAKGVEAFMDFLKARANGPDRHTGQVYYFDRKGQLALRSVDFPPAQEVVRALGELAAEG
jgi:protein SCO1/2